MKKIVKKAFSLVELMVTLIVVSCLIAAMAPVITKKLKNNSITISNGGSSSGSTSGCDISCASNQAKDSSTCTCSDCSTLFGESCLKCDITKCSECLNANYLNNGQCIECPDGYYCDGTNKIICPKGFYCIDGEKNQCPSGTYSDNTGISASTDCKLCSTLTPNCATCDIATGSCTTCKVDYELSENKCEAISTNIEYTYTGSYSETTNSSGKQKIYLKTSGIFTSLATKKVTLFLVGGGGAGGFGYESGGGGGGGGYSTETKFTLNADTEYSATIGAGGKRNSGNGESTTFYNFEAYGGSGGAGSAWMCDGCGAGGAPNGGNPGCDGGDGNQFDGEWYGGGGGGGWGPTSGGLGGGASTYDWYVVGQSASANTGGGGSAGGYGSKDGGDGGSGIVVILVD